MWTLFACLWLGIKFFVICDVVEIITGKISGMLPEEEVEGFTHPLSHSHTHTHKQPSKLQNHNCESTHTHLT